MSERTLKLVPARGKITRSKALATATALRNSGELLSGTYKVPDKIRVTDTASGSGVIVFETRMLSSAPVKLAPNAHVRRAAKRKSKKKK